MEKRDVKKLAMDAYNLGMHDFGIIYKPRSIKSFDDWFSYNYKLKLKDKSNFLSPEIIEEIIFHYFETSWDKVYKKSREEPWIYYRQLIQYFMWRYSKLKESEIGKWTGNLDRTTVIHSIKMIKKYHNTSIIKKREIGEIEKQLQNQKA